MTDKLLNCQEKDYYRSPSFIFFEDASKVLQEVELINCGGKIIGLFKGQMTKLIRVELSK